MRRYNILNNSLGWACFLIAAVTYLLTLEPTASFWDCPEFITQGFKLEIGHPPGNPIFMLTARFFANFAGGDVTKVAWCVNAMSALLSAGTILLLFWTITHLVKRLTVRDNATEVSTVKMMVIFGSGICGALMYAWSDTFWFSAVEAEVYAYSSFCTALVFWLILKWEARADNPGSDRYLILIAYVIGISIAVHLLNLLCIPAIVLVVYYRKWAKPTAVGSIIALLISFAIVVLILYGLVPGFVKVSQWFELFCVNTLHMSFNVGVLIYAIVVLCSLCWTVYNIYARKSLTLIRISFLLSTLLSGILFIGHGWVIPVLLIIGLACYLFICRRLPLRILNLSTLSILVIFIGYSSYALLLIRSSAHTPMNQNAPDNVFALSSYLNREQYGQRPLIYGETLNSGVVYDETGKVIILEEGTEHARSPHSSNDRYEEYKPASKRVYKQTPELNMLLPRIYSNDARHKAGYASWLGKPLDEVGEETEITIMENTANGEKLYTDYARKPTFGENLKFFFTYQLNHMYWRYFLWNFAGRQNDIQGEGEPTRGNWISGFSFIDNPRLGDQSLLPDELGEGNKGHNVFYMLPLILGLIGLIWQASASKRGTEQFWVVFFLFFMTGIAIVLYLNQTPGQPRERDYAFAGSFYAYAIWVGIGVAGIWRMILRLADSKIKRGTDEAEADYEFPAGSKNLRKSMIAAAVACVIGLIVPLQVVSQTWDDHDRSGRYAARDFGINYLESLEPNAIIFTYGDNDTFPLWYAQEVEGVRTDVKVVNLSYLMTDWYIDQIRKPSYDAPGIDLLATPEVYAMENLQAARVTDQTADDIMDAREALDNIYRQALDPDIETPVWPTRYISIPANAAGAVKSGVIDPEYEEYAQDIIIDLAAAPYQVINTIIAYDMIAESAANGWNRPIYFAITIPSENYMGLSPYFHNTGLAYQVVPLNMGGEINTDKAFENITGKFRWGGMDQPGAEKMYVDETVGRMARSNRGVVLDCAAALAASAGDIKSYIDTQTMYADSTTYVDTDEIAEYKASYDDNIAKAKTMFEIYRTKIPASVLPLQASETYDYARALYDMAEASGDENYRELARTEVLAQLENLGKLLAYYYSLSPELASMLSGIYDTPNITVMFPRLYTLYLELGGDINEVNAKVVKPNGLSLDNIARKVSRERDSIAADYSARGYGEDEINRALYEYDASINALIRGAQALRGKK